MTTHQEDEVLERLNEQDGPRGFFLEVVTILEEAVDSLMRRAFRQEEYAVKYAIEPCSTRAAPSASWRYASSSSSPSGSSLERYQDLEAYLKIRDFLVRDPKDYRFSDKPIRDLLARLHGVSQGGMMPQEAPANEEDWPSTRCS